MSIYSAQLTPEKFQLSSRWLKLRRFSSSATLPLSKFCLIWKTQREKLFLHFHHQCQTNARAKFFVLLSASNLLEFGVVNRKKLMECDKTAFLFPFFRSLSPAFVSLFKVFIVLRVSISSKRYEGMRVKQVSKSTRVVYQKKKGLLPIVEISICGPQVTTFNLVGSSVSSPLFYALKFKHSER